MLAKSLRTLQCLSLILCLLLLSHAAQAQKSKEKKEKDAPVLLKLNVLVTDAAGYPTNKPSQNDFQVLQDGTAREVAFFKKREGVVTYGFAIDTSGSVKKYINKIVAAARLIAANGNPDDEAFVEGFVDSDQLETMQDFTSDKKLLDDALSTLYLKGGQTALIDAVYVGVQHVMEYKAEQKERRRSLILITDGDERLSYYDQKQLFKLLRDSDVKIFVIGFVQAIGDEVKREKAMKLLKRLAYETGGQAFFPDLSKMEMQLYVTEIIRGLNAQYTLGYYPEMLLDKADEQKVEVKVTTQPGSPPFRAFPDSFEFNRDLLKKMH